jgi:hypothetical protein
MVRTAHDINDALLAQLGTEVSEPELVDLGLSVPCSTGWDDLNSRLVQNPEPYGTEYAV